MRLAAIALFIVAFARPRSGTEYQEITSEGVDIMLLLDVSSSMQGEDFKPNNRLFVAKEEIKKFIERRLNDRIGLVVFARYAYTQCPLTTDYGVLLNFVDQVDFGLVEDGTAIGMAIATAVNRLRESESESKIIVLLTDGDNNAGEIDPITAASLATTFDIKIYTIGVGKPGNVMFPYQDPIFGKRYVLLFVVYFVVFSGILFAVPQRSPQIYARDRKSSCIGSAENCCPQEACGQVHSGVC